MMYPHSFGSSYYLYNMSQIMAIGMLVAVILAVVVYFTFLSKKNEGKFTGFKGKVYNFFCFNKFYAEELFKLIYIILAAVITVMGIISLFGSFVAGVIMIVIGNVALRIIYELVMMFIILCRRTVSIDKKLDKITAFYGDDFDEGGVCGESCNGDCGAGCDGDCNDECAENNEAGCESNEGCGGCSDDSTCESCCGCGTADESAEAGEDAAEPVQANAQEDPEINTSDR